MLRRIARCACGAVEIEADGSPIVGAVCYCDTCQKGGAAIEALRDAVPVVGPDGGTEYLLYRKDRVRYTKGANLLVGYRVDEDSVTSRMVASCCNSAMVMRLANAMHWIPVYRKRFAGDIPALQFRICTKFKPEHAVIPTDIPSSEMYPAGFMWKLLTSKVAMLLRARSG